MTLQKRAKKKTLCGPFGGEGGIRTRGGLLTHTRFPGVRLKPLIHLSNVFIVTVPSEGTL